ncbi:MAG: hypothetical protein ACK55O_03425 [Phycisphaerales bacterium]
MLFGPATPPIEVSPKRYLLPTALPRWRAVGAGLLALSAVLLIIGHTLPMSSALALALRQNLPHLGFAALAAGAVILLLARGDVLRLLRQGRTDPTDPPRSFGGDFARAAAVFLGVLALLWLAHEVLVLRRGPSLFVGASLLLPGAVFSLACALQLAESLRERGPARFCCGCGYAFGHTSEREAPPCCAECGRPWLGLLWHAPARPKARSVLICIGLVALALAAAAWRDAIARAALRPAHPLLLMIEPPTSPFWLRAHEVPTSAALAERTTRRLIDRWRSSGQWGDAAIWLDESSRRGLLSRPLLVELTELQVRSLRRRAPYAVLGPAPAGLIMLSMPGQALVIPGLPVAVLVGIASADGPFAPPDHPMVLDLPTIAMGVGVAGGMSFMLPPALHGSAGTLRVRIELRDSIDAAALRTIDLTLPPP